MMSLRGVRKHRFTSRMTAIAWFLCVAVGSMSAFVIDAPNRDDVVFCPLQRQWVQKTRPRIIASRSPMSGICASGKDKSHFLQRLADVGTRMDRSSDAA